MDPESKDLALAELKVAMKEYLPDTLLEDEAFLRRWLIARDYNVEKATEMLKNWVTWRKDYKIDEILDWEPPQDLKEACPYEISFCDKNGRPVLVFPWAKWRPWEFTDTGRKDEYQKYMYQMLEKSVAAIKKPATQFVIFGDSDGLSFSHMSHTKALDANLEVLRGFECKYPEMMSLGISINCPKVFSVLFNILRPLMSSRTQQKLVIFDSNSAKWKKFLAQHISVDDLPEKYGGRSKSNSCDLQGGINLLTISPKRTVQVPS